MMGHHTNPTGVGNFKKPSEYTPAEKAAEEAWRQRQDLSGVSPPTPPPPTLRELIENIRAQILTAAEVLYEVQEYIPSESAAALTIANNDAVTALALLDAAPHLCEQEGGLSIGAPIGTVRGRLVPDPVSNG